MDWNRIEDAVFQEEPLKLKLGYDRAEAELAAPGCRETFNLPVVSHLVPELQVHTIAAIPNGLTVEYMPWTLRFYEETPKIEDGQIVVPDAPGLGLKFDEAALQKYQVE